MISTLKW